MSVVDGNEHRGDQFRVGIHSEPNKRRIRKSQRNLLFLSRCGRTRGSIDRRYSDVLPRRQRRKDMRNFARGSCWPEFVAVSGLNLRICRALLKCPVLGSPRLGHVVTSKTKGKSVALDTLPDPRMPNEDLWFYPDPVGRTSHPEFWPITRGINNKYRARESLEFIIIDGSPCIYKFMWQRYSGEDKRYANKI